MTDDKWRLTSPSGLAASDITTTSYGAPPDDHAIYNLIGRVASGWAHLELILDQIIWDLAEIQKPRGACLTAQMVSVYPRFEAILALIEHRLGNRPEYESAKKAVNKLYGQCRDQTYNRARTIHDAWYVAIESGETAQHRNMPKKELTYGITDKDRTELETDIETLKHLTEKAGELKKKILGWLSS